MHRMMEQEKEKAMSGTRHETQPVATIIYENGTELTGTAVTTSDGSVGIRIPDGSFRIALNSDGSMPEGVESAGIRPEHPEGGLPLTDDMVYMAVTASLRDAVGLPLNEAADRYESWLNRVRRAAIEKWVDSLPERESMRLHRRYLDRDGAGHPKEEGGRMTLIEHEARVGLPRMWEHPKRTRTRRGGVVASMVSGYTAILLVRQPNGVENSIRRQCASLNEAEAWLDKEIGEDE